MSIQKCTVPMFGNWKDCDYYERNGPVKALPGYCKYFLADSKVKNGLCVRLTEDPFKPSIIKNRRNVAKEITEDIFGDCEI